jgi:ActR/RegA family two-component response regulator
MDDDYDEINMRIEEDEGLCLINKLKMEDQDTQ